VIEEYFNAPTLRVPGRGPSSAWEMFRRNTMTAIQACEICRMFSVAQARGMNDGRALVTAYELYCDRFERLGVTTPKRKLRAVEVDISFERAFDLVRETFGCFGSKKKLQMLTCGNCGSLYLDDIGAINTSHAACPYCRLRKHVEQGHHVAIIERVRKLGTRNTNDSIASNELTRKGFVSGDPQEGQNATESSN
jgi:DNA-directed RNA polymerase subunit RPC12/RpoP